MLVDGKAIARELASSLAREAKLLKPKPSLAVFITQPSFIIQKFVEIKARVAEEVGVTFEVIASPHRETTEDFAHHLLTAARTHDGLLVQLPLAASLDADTIRRILPITHDVDVYGMTAFQQFKEKHLPILPPVVAATSEILYRNHLTPAGKHVVIVGDGQLVGKPASIWATHMGANVTTVTRETHDIATHTRSADIIILGAGSPGLLKPDMITEGVVIIDAGTSESEGKLAGDADPACADKASLMTPVPGGVGPIAVAKVFENLLTLRRLRSGERI